MNKIRILDKDFELSISSEQIKNAVKAIAEKINTDYYSKNPLFVVVLNGAFMFASDLLKETSLNSEISFVKYASYQGEESTGNVKQLIGFNEEIKGKEIIILEDIIDTGLTLTKITELLKKLEPANIKIATLLYKPEACKVNIKPDYIGIEIPNDFIVGYGLDYNGRGRNLKNIYTVCK